MVDAIVLAGSSNDGPLKECSEVRYEALIPIGAKIMVQYVVEALLGCHKVRRVLVVGPVAELSPYLKGERVSIIKAPGGIMENIEAGLMNCLEAERVLLVTSDIPMLTTRAINDFLELCGDMNADLYYPIISKRVVESKFPTTRRTYVNLKEGVFTGGNLFLINPAVFKKCVENGQKIINLRKSPFGLCRLIGFGFVLKFLMHSLTINEAEQKVSALLGRIKGIVVMSKYPEVGVDVDKPSDLALVLRTLGA